MVFHFAGAGALIAGDALCTWNPLTGRPGPQIMPSAFALSSDQEMASLALIEPIEAGALLVGPRRAVDRRGGRGRCAGALGRAELGRELRH